MVKLSLNVTEEDIATLRELAASRGTTLTQVLRQAITNEKFFHDEWIKGWPLFLGQNGKFREIIFRP